ncbi:MAG: hypothetical protein Q8R92_06195 [Deltaproteobacteria bacterium]|nr:hypothetical protein [Deltaproteobacteria bacterium]
MMGLETRVFTAADAGAVLKLTREQSYPEFRWYRLTKQDFAVDYLAWQVERFLGEEACFGRVVVKEGEIVGFVGAARSPWESEHFGLPMATIAHIFARGEGNERAAIAAALLASLEGDARDRGFRHLRGMSDIEDTALLLALQERKFLLVDTLVTYISDNQRPPAAPPPVDPSFTFETYRKEDFGRIDPGEISHIAKFMREAYRIDRFHADPRLPREKCHEVYVEWFRNVFNGNWADGVHLLRKEGRVVGFLGFQYFAEIEARYGSKIIGRGLSAVLPEGRGGYSALTHATVNLCPYGSRHAEFDSQIQNFPVINVWVRNGLSFARGRYTLHRWLDR